MPRRNAAAAPPSGASQPWHRRPEVRFLALFVAVLSGSFLLLAWKPVNDHLVEPFTGWVAVASGVGLELVGQDITRQGTILRSSDFAVNIRNGCNGVEAMVILLAAVVAFPASWRARLLGLGIGILGIQLVNLVRVIALFLTGAYFPRFFDSSHTVVWQTVVIASAIALWLFWARRFATPQQPAAAE